MKTTRKMVGLMSAVAMLASLAATPVSAARINAYSVSYETLTEAIETDNGETVPAGAIAVTMSVNGNTGFNANTVTLDVKEGYTVLTDEEDEPIIEKGSVLDNALIGKAVNGNVVSVTMALAESTTKNGDLFTIYCTTNASAEVNFVQVEQLQHEVAVESAASLRGGAIGADSVIIPPYICFYGGDCDNNNVVNAIDASLVLQAMAKSDYQDLDVKVYDYLEYFPSTIIAKQSDANGDGKITHPNPNTKDDDEAISAEESDAQTILEYAACRGANIAYTGYGSGTVGVLLKAYKLA